MQSKATTVAQYLASLEPERRKVIAAVRKTVRAHLPKGYVEAMNWGMIAYEIPLRRYPETYNGQPLMYAALAAQKNNFALYMTGSYGDPKFATWMRNAYKKAGLKLDMGKSCLRFKRLEDLPLDVIGEAIGRLSVDDYIRRYEKVKKKPG
jgi:uncharacterized protein YdhG (YjbR/CyaY superfamily)